MATTILNVITVTNISSQTVTINVNAKPGSLITSVSGSVHLQPNQSFTAEDDRFNLGQLRQVRNLGLISYTNSRSSVEISTGSTGS